MNNSAIKIENKNMTKLLSLILRACVVILMLRIAKKIDYDAVFCGEPRSYWELSQKHYWSSNPRHWLCEKETHGLWQSLASVIRSGKLPQKQSFTWRLINTIKNAISCVIKQGIVSSENFFR